MFSEMHYMRETKGMLSLLQTNFILHYSIHTQKSDASCITLLKWIHSHYIKKLQITKTLHSLCV